MSTFVPHCHISHSAFNIAYSGSCLCITGSILAKICNDLKGLILIHSSYILKSLGECADWQTVQLLKWERQD